MKTIARFFLFLATLQIALGQPTVPPSNLSPVTNGTVIGRFSTGTGRGELITIGGGLSLSSSGILTATGSGGGAAPSNATFITQTPNTQLSNEQALSLLSTGILKSTTGTGVITIATPNSDFMAWVPAGTSGNILTSNGTGWTSAAPATSGNVTAAGTLDSGNIVIGQGGKAVATSSALSVSGSNVTITGNLGISGSTTFNNLTTSNLTVTGNIIGNLSASQVTISDAGGYYVGTEVESALQEVGGNIVALQSVIGPTPSGNQLISGGGVALAPGGGLDITVSAASYLIQGTTYNSAITNLTLSAADPSNPRIDVVAVNSSGNAVIIEGTPAATPAKPDVDPSTQLELTFFLVGAGATELDVDVVEIYLENAEWTTTQSGGTINVASTNNPYTGTVCIEGTSVTTGNYVQFVKPASGTFDMADSDNLVFYIRSKASWANNRLMTITVRNGSGQLGSAVTFDQGLFGFNSSQTSTYQQIIIPTALFAANGLSTATTIRITVGGSGGSLGFYIDDVTLQGGVASITDASRMKWRGNYLASNFYNVNDVVLSSGIQYVAIQAGVGNTPASSPTFWQASTSNSGGTVTVSGTPTSGQLAAWTSATNIQGIATPGSSGNILTSNGTAWTSAAPAASGNVTASGSPTSGQTAEFTTATNIVGVGTVGTGNYVKDTSPSFQTNIVLANGTSPTTGAAAATAFDTNAWAASRGAIQVHDGTANTYVVGALASDTPSNGQVPTWNTGGTITWETPTTGSGTVNSGTSGQIAYYSASSATISGAVLPKLEVNASTNNLSAFTFYNVFQYPFSKSDTTGRNTFGLVSNDGANPFGLTMNFTGNATAANRKVKIDVGAVGVAEAGILQLNTVATEVLATTGTGDVSGRFTGTATEFAITAPGSNAGLWMAPSGTGYFHAGATSYSLGSFSIYNSFEYPFAKTDTTPRNTFFIGSNDASNPFGLNVNITGNATASNRIVKLQVGAVGVDTSGDLRLDGTQVSLYGASSTLSATATSTQLIAERTTAATTSTDGALYSKGGLSVAGNVVTAGTIKTASPSGGTAQPFKIGNVASVTPTSPNRTIEIEINGTTYYLTAKTTND
jgi:hypothetical protein